MNGLDQIAAAQAAWAELFEAFDVVLAPPFGTAAFPHTDETVWSARRLTINGEATPCEAQIAWPGIATFPGLPATCARSAGNAHLVVAGRLACRSASRSSARATRTAPPSPTPA